MVQIAEHARGADGSQFDGMWSSSLTGSASKGKPDIEYVSTSQRLDLVADAFEVTGKPMIYDGDTGGHPEVFHFTVRSLERLGVSAVIIEDKTGLKQNSLFGTERKQSLIDIDEFSAKIKAGCAARCAACLIVPSLANRRAHHTKHHSKCRCFATAGMPQN